MNRSFLLIIRSFVKILKWYCWDKSCLASCRLKQFLSRFCHRLYRTRFNGNTFLPIPDSFGHKFADTNVLLLSYFLLVRNPFHWRLPQNLTGITIFALVNLHGHLWNWPLLWTFVFHKHILFSFSYIHFIEIILNHFQLHWNKCNSAQYSQVQIG